MAASCSFEDLSGAISWNRLEMLLSSQQSSYGCRKIVFDVVQRLKSKRYETVLNTFTLLHTYSVNASSEALKHLASDHIYNVFVEIQKGKSNTLAAGLAQLLHDWKHMFKDEGLGAKFDQLYHEVLPRAAPQIRPSAPAEKYLRDPPTGATGSECFRRPLHRGFDFALFNQKARRISFASGAANPNAASSTGGSSNMPPQPQPQPSTGTAGGNFYRATTLPTPASDRPHPVPSKQPSADVPNTPVHEYAAPDQASPVSSGYQSPSPLAADYASSAVPSSPPALPASRQSTSPTSQPPVPRPQIPSLVSRQIPPAARPAPPAATDRTHDNLTKSSLYSYLDSAPLDTTMPEPSLPEQQVDSAQARPRDASASTISSQVRTQDPPTESDAGVAGNSISRLQDRLVEDFGSPKHADKAATPSMPALSSHEIRSRTMPQLTHTEGSGTGDDSNCVISEILSTQPGTHQYVPSTVAEESAAEAGSVLEPAEDVGDMVLGQSGDVSSPAAAAHSAVDSIPGDAAAAAPPEPLEAQTYEADSPPRAPSSVPAGRTPVTQSNALHAVMPASEGEQVRAAVREDPAQYPVHREGPHTVALRVFANAPPGAATISFKDCAPRNIVRRASELESRSDSVENVDTMSAGVQARREAAEPLQPTPEEGEENALSQLTSHDMAGTPTTHADTAAASTSGSMSPVANALTPEALRAKELIDALVTHCELVARFRRLVDAARLDGNQRQQETFLELGATQAQTCRQQRQQLHHALALLGAEQALMAELLKANDMCSLELRLWEQMAGAQPHCADDRPGQPLQELILDANAGVTNVGTPDAAMAAKVAQHSLDSGRVSLLANVARQPALRLCDASYVAAIADATHKRAH
eukprot:jgi/Ulvmu1/7586/UM038_0009.1